MVLDLGSWPWVQLRTDPLQLIRLCIKAEQVLRKEEQARALGDERHCANKTGDQRVTTASAICRLSPCNSLSPFALIQPCYGPTPALHALATRT